MVILTFSAGLLLLLLLLLRCVVWPSTPGVGDDGEDDTPAVRGVAVPGPVAVAVVVELVSSSSSSWDCIHLA